jgi:hypothetical protein
MATQGETGCVESFPDLSPARQNFWLQMGHKLPENHHLYAEESRAPQLSQSYADPDLHKLLSDVAYTAKVASISTLKKFILFQNMLELRKNHRHHKITVVIIYLRKNPSDGQKSKSQKHQKHVARSSRRVLNSSIDLITGEKSVQVELQEAMGYGVLSSADKAAVDKTMQKLQNQLSTALKLLREYMQIGESEDKFPSRQRISCVFNGVNAPSTIYSASPESPGEVPLEDKDSPILSKDSERARQLMSLASQKSML